MSILISRIQLVFESTRRKKVLLVVRPRNPLPRRLRLIAGVVRTMLEMTRRMVMEVAVVMQAGQVEAGMMVAVVEEEEEEEEMMAEMTGIPGGLFLEARKRNRRRQRRKNGKLPRRLLPRTISAGLMMLRMAAVMTGLGLPRQERRRKER
jgi:hypothetical protein